MFWRPWELGNVSYWDHGNMYWLYVILYDPSTRLYLVQTWHSLLSILYGELDLQIYLLWSYVGCGRCKWCDSDDSRKTWQNRLQAAIYRALVCHHHLVIFSFSFCFEKTEIFYCGYKWYILSNQMSLDEPAICTLLLCYKRNIFL